MKYLKILGVFLLGSFSGWYFSRFIHGKAFSIIDAIHIFLPTIFFFLGEDIGKKRGMVKGYTVGSSDILNHILKHKDCPEGRCIHEERSDNVLKMPVKE